MKIITLRNKPLLDIDVLIAMVFWLSELYSFFVKSFLKQKLLRFLNKRNTKNLQSMYRRLFFLNKLLSKAFCFFQLPPNSILLHIRISLLNPPYTHIYIINSKALDLYKNAFQHWMTTVLSINKNYMKWFILSLKKGRAIKWSSTSLGLYT